MSAHSRRPRSQDSVTFSMQHSPRNSGVDSEDLTILQVDDGFTSVGVGELLEVDPRPTFVLNSEASLDTPFEPIFVNAALRLDIQLRKSIPLKNRAGPPLLALKAPSTNFCTWIKNVAHFRENAISSVPFRHCDVLWTAFTLKQWIIVSGDRDAAHNTGIQTTTEGVASSLSQQRTGIYREEPGMKPKRALTSSSSDDIALLNRQGTSSDAAFVTPGTPDWTVQNPQGELSSHVIFARSVDWSTTPLGDMNTWSREFRQIACLLMANPHPAALFWGDELTVIYNKAYADGVAGHKHPALMGTGFQGPFKELWDFVSTIFAECQETGKSVAVENQMLPIERHGFVEETFYTWSLTPLYGGTNEILGLYNAPFETTRQTRSARALQTLFKLGQEISTAKAVSTFWPKILSGLTDNVADFPFVILYSVVEDSSDDESLSTCSGSSQTFKSCVLEGTLGVPDGHAAAPPRLDLKRSRGGFVPAFRDALLTREPKLLTIKDGTLSESLIEGIEWRGMGDPCREAVVCPLRPTTGENVIGFMVVGVNPRRQFDEDYQSFIQLLDRQLATSLASVSLFETEVRRGLTAAEAAAFERSRLSEELSNQRNRLQRIAEVSPVGMFSIDSNGILLDANDKWFDMTGHSRDKVFGFSWMNVIHEDSTKVVEKSWTDLTVDQVPWTGELRLLKPWRDPATGEQFENWILASSQPEYEDGHLKSIMGCITDISKIKWAETLQTRRLQEAEETRRAQNNFIDITSHEMRNPLSAILQCAEGISTSLSEIMGRLSLEEADSYNIKESVSNAETIQLCAQHQKSIVDDILTISKLDSNLLLITPVAIQPVEIVKQALQMFMVECQKVHDIKMEFKVDKSFEDLKINMVMLDSSRLLQVLINLLTNAIKFTKSSKKKMIDVSIGAYLSPPTKGDPSFKYFPTKKAVADVTTAPDWGTGEILYLRFEVTDTGCGLTAEEKNKLFNRFQQASPRTHVQYGGSGLGLFISRQLTELQGGEIGVASEAGVGSTFAFYVKGRRADSQQNEVQLQKKLSSDLQSNARLTSNEPKNPREHAGSVSTLSQLTDSAGSSSSSAQDSDPKTWHVLIVEDNLVNQKILAQQIRKLGSLVHVANHGGEALDLLRTTKHFKGKETDGIELSVILMDLEMPVMDGLTCVRKIREMESEGLISTHLPIIAVTANARGEQIANAKDSGMDDVMPKPFRILQIRTKIEALLSKSR